jgi:ketosteroid isomerase-like protein
MASKAPKKEAQTPAQVEATVRDFFRFYAEKNFVAKNAMVHPDAVFSYPEMQYTNPENTMGAAGLKSTLERDGATFVDLQMRIDNVWVDGNTAFVEGYFIGSKLNKVPYLHRIEVEGRQIKSVRSHYDTALFYQVQLGVQGPTMENPIPPWMKALAAEAAVRAHKSDSAT